MATSSVRPRRKTNTRKTAVHKAQLDELKRVSLSRAALEFLVSKSPTPAVFDHPPKEPPFELRDH